MASLRVAVAGAGAFGRNHLRVYRDLQTAHPGQVQLVGLVEPEAARRAELAASHGIPGFASLAEMLAGPPDQLPQAVSVCVPTTQHAAVAEQLLLAGIDVLIEKPFAASLAEADRILALARGGSQAGQGQGQDQNQARIIAGNAGNQTDGGSGRGSGGREARIVAIGHLERFNPAVSATLAALNRPMFFEAHRLSIFTPRSLDVDVVLDLMIHDLDIVLALTDSAVREVRAVGLAVLSRNVDIANVRVEFENGCVANFTASRVSTEQVRKLRLFQPRQYLSLDFARQELLSIVVSGEAGEHGAADASDRSTAATSGTVAAGPAALHPSSGLALSKPEIARAEPLRLELEDFLRAVRDRTPPRVTAEAGRAALALALEINAQIASHAERAGLV